jgi:hypothetical protein
MKSNDNKINNIHIIVSNVVDYIIMEDQSTISN